MRRNIRTYLLFHVYDCYLSLVEKFVYFMVWLGTNSLPDKLDEIHSIFLATF